MSKGNGKGKGASPAPAKNDERPDDEDQALAIRQLGEAAGSAHGSVQIYRIVPGGRDKYLEKMALLQFAEDPHEILSERYGGGEYRVQARDESGRVLRSFRLDVDGLPKVRTPESAKLADVEKRLQEAMDRKNGGGLDGMSITELMRFQLELTKAQLGDMRNPPAAAQNGNPAEMAVAMVTAIQSTQVPLLEAIMSKMNTPAPDPMAPMLMAGKMMLMMKELFGSGNGSRSGWEAIADKLADPIGQLVGQHVENQRNGVAPPATMAARPNPPDPNGGGDMSGKPEWYRALSTQIPMLLAWAEQGRDPMMCADWVIDGVPDEYLGPMHHYLSQPTFLDEVVRYFPDAARHREWLRGFVSRALENIVAIPEDDGPPEGEEDSGDAAGVEVGTGAPPE